MGQCSGMSLERFRQRAAAITAMTATTISRLGEGSEVICVREKAPPVGSAEQLVARPCVSDDLPTGVERIPVNRRKDGVLTELANVERDPFPVLNVRRFAIGADGRGEVIQHGAAVRHVDRLAPSDSKERAKTEACHTFHISCRPPGGASTL